MVAGSADRRRMVCQSDARGCRLESIAPNTVTRLRTPDRDGYTAVQLGTEEQGEAQQAARRPARATCRSLGTLREFRVDDASTATRSARPSPSATCSPTATSSTSAACRRARASRATSSATTSTAARRPTAPTTIASRARSARARRPAASTRACAMAGHMGDERVDDQEGPRRPRRRREEPAARQGQPARRPRQPDPGPEGLSDAVRPPSTTGPAASVGSVELHDELFARAGERGRAPPERDRPARRPAERAPTTPRRVARSAAAAKSRTARRAPAWRARAPAPRRTTAAAAPCSGRIRAPMSSGCRAR